MDTRLAQVIALSIGPDGHPDPARVFDALRLSADDPVAIIIEGVLETRRANQEEIKTLRRLLDDGHQRTGEMLKKHAEKVSEDLNAHRDSIGEYASDLETRADRILSTSAKIIAQTEQLAKDASVVSNRALLAVFGLGLAAGAVSAFALALLLHHWALGAK